MIYELTVDDLDDKLRKMLSDILVNEGVICPKSDEELVACINKTTLRSLINDEYLAQKHSLVSTAP